MEADLGGGLAVGARHTLRLRLFRLRGRAGVSVPDSAHVHLNTGQRIAASVSQYRAARSKRVGPYGTPVPTYGNRMLARA
eukprot:1075653-Rhodomonas_salina.1